jgi:hypothetical protein
VPHPGPPATRHLRLAPLPAEPRRHDGKVLLLARALSATLRLFFATLAALAASTAALAPLLWRRAPLRGRLRPIRTPEARIIPFEPRRQQQQQQALPR